MSSPGSYYSTVSQEDNPGQSRGLAGGQAQRQPLPGLGEQQSTGQSLYDVEAWLSQPANIALLESVTRRGGLQQSSEPNSDPARSNSQCTDYAELHRKGMLPERIFELSGFSISVSNFTMACQKRSLVPAFDIVEISPQKFGGTLQVAGQSVSLESNLQPSKKAAKGLLATMGMKLLSSIEPISAPQETNWVGRLAEYLITLPGAPNPTYTHTTAICDSSANPAFNCEVKFTILRDSGLIELSFTTSHTFPSKQASKAASAKKAILHFVSLGELSQDGRIVKTRTSRIKNPIHTEQRSFNSLEPSSSSLNVAIPPFPAATPLTPKIFNSVANENIKPGSYASRVNALYPILGLKAPEYRIGLAEGATDLFSGAAYFPSKNIGPAAQGDGLHSGPIGQVRNVYGRKKAKEECAKGVLAYLEGVVEQRTRGA